MITTIHGYPLRPGLVAEWTLHPVDSAEPLVDNRPPSYLQEEHLRAAALARQSGGSAGAWLATAFDLPGEIDPATMESVFRSLIARHESLRTGFRFTGQQLSRVSYADTQLQLRATIVGEFADGDDIAVHLESRFDEATNPLDSVLPSFFATIIRPDSTTVLLASDHSRTDGYSIFLAPHELHELYAATQNGSHPRRLAEVGSHADYSHDERSKGAAIGPEHRGVLVWEEFLNACGGALPEFPLDRGVRHGQLPQWGGTHDQLLTAADADAFDAACKQDGGQFLTGVAAATAIAVHELGAAAEFHTTIPVHTRTHQRWATSLGWYVNSLPVSIRLTGTNDFTAVIANTAQALRKALPALRVPCSRAWELTGTIPLLRNMVSYMDLRATPGSEHWNKWNMSCIGKPPPGDHVFFWFIRTHDGISITGVYPDTNISQDTMPRVIERIRHIMTTVATTGSYAIHRSAAHSTNSPDRIPA